MLNVLVAQADVEASAKADFLKQPPRKAPVYTRRPYRKPTQVGGHKCAKARE